MEDQPEKTKQRRERTFTGGEWIGVIVISLLLTTSSTTQNNVSLISNPARWMGSFFGSFFLVVVVWLIVRAIYRRITKKKPVA